MTTEQEYAEAARTVLDSMARWRVLKVAAALLARASRDCPNGVDECPCVSGYTAEDCCRCHVEAMERDQ